MEARRQDAKSEWPSGKGGAAKRRKLAERQLAADARMEHGPGFAKPKPGQPNRKTMVVVREA
jgi:hypothetical protein